MKIQPNAELRRKVKLGDVVSFTTGKLNSNAALADGAYPFFTCSQETFKTNTYSFDTECVLLAGNNANGVYPIKYFSGKFDAYQRTYVIRSLNQQQLDNRYLYFAMQPKLGLLKSISTGAATKFLTLGILMDIDFELPPISTQRKIAAILSAYDDLIENNTRRIKILEEMAQMIYREWFVNFRFPGHEKVKMVDSASGPIPEGWEAATLREVTSYINRGISPQYTDESDQLVINQRCIREGAIDLALARRHSSKVSPEKIVRSGDVLINSTGVGTLGRIAQVYQELPACTVDSHVSIVRPADSVNADYFGRYLLELQSHFETLGVGATGQTELGRDIIARTSFPLPPKEVQEMFSSIVSPINSFTVRLSIMTENLVGTRDLLLPKLVSGEVGPGSVDLSMKGTQR